MKTVVKKSLIAGALLLASGGVSRSEPSPDLMNFALDSARACVKKHEPSLAKVKHACPGSWSWTKTHNITAGQSTVAVPEFTRCWDR